MEVYGKLVQKVNIDPLQVIDNLLNVGPAEWVFENEGHYFKKYEVSAGCHSLDMTEEIPKEDYLYVKALYTIKDYLEHKSNE